MDRNLTASGAVNRIEPLDVVSFPLDSDKLVDSTANQVDTTATWLKAHDHHKIVLEGHTDKLGSTPYNEDLSTRRMQAVRERLIADGIDSDRIVMLTYGEAEATDPNNPSNRRVVMFASKENIDNIVGMQRAGRPVAMAVWTDKGQLMELEPGKGPVKKTAVSHR